jgi:glycosyltransferase involved in cell wall biosynthesis
MRFRSLSGRERRGWRWLGRLVTVLEREGARALASRKLSQVSALVAERSRVRRMRLRPWLRDDRAVFLLISHRCGGGTERHLSDLEAALRALGIRPVVVRPGHSGRLLWEERGGDRKTRWCRESSTDSKSIAEMLGSIEPVHAHVHHSLGLPETLFDALANRGIPYDLTIHDYHTICPRINLIGPGGRYCGEPEDAGCNSCLARLGDDQGRPVSESIAEWRLRNAGRLANARRVFAPNADVVRRLGRYFPGRELTLRPHAESLPFLEDRLVEAIRAGEPIRVAVIGTLVAVKGSQRLLACARDARTRGLPLEFHVIGSTDRDAALSRLGNVHITGRYREREVYDLIASRRAHLAFLPSECPESYMYTLSIAMAAGLFVVCFDLGAQAERVRNWGWGRPIEPELEPGEINDELIAAAHALAENPNPPSAPAPASYPDLLGSYYDFTAEESNRFGGFVAGGTCLSRSSRLAVPGRGHAHLH